MIRDYRVQFWGAITGVPLFLSVGLGLAVHRARTKPSYRAARKART